jgi:GMP synthase-like glutamine amidotransferase
MRISVLQHVPFEGIGSMADEFAARGYCITTHHLYRNEPLPEQDEFDWLVVMGGPMNVDDTVQYPWLTAEKHLIATAISSGKRVLGICLGAQLIARALGAPVTPGRHREIGWHPIQGVPTRSIYGPLFASNPTVFHWHGDTFALPQGALPLAASDACEQQAFALGTRVLALQFHLETTTDSAQALLKHCGDELDGNRYVQSADAITGSAEQFAAIRVLMAHAIEIMANADIE